MAARELRLSDLQLQHLLAGALQQRLREAGFVSGIPSNVHSGLMFPVSLNLAGLVSVTRTESGEWVFVQQDLAGPLDERMAAAAQSHTESVHQTLVRLMDCD